MRLDHLLSKEETEKRTFSKAMKVADIIGITLMMSDVVLEKYCSILREQGFRKQRKRSPNNRINGGVAQLGEHLPCKQGVKGSIPFISTNTRKRKGDSRVRARRKQSNNGRMAQVVRVFRAKHEKIRTD